MISVLDLSASLRVYFWSLEFAVARYLGWCPCLSFRISYSPHFFEASAVHPCKIKLLKVHQAVVVVFLTMLLCRYLNSRHSPFYQLPLFIWLILMLHHLLELSPSVQEVILLMVVLRADEVVSLLLQGGSVNKGRYVQKFIIILSVRPKLSLRETHSIEVWIDLPVPHVQRHLWLIRELKGSSLVGCPWLFSPLIGQ